jgi:hypothetical protein
LFLFLWFVATWIKLELERSDPCLISSHFGSMFSFGLAINLPPCLCKVTFKCVRKKKPSARKKRRVLGLRPKDSARIAQLLDGAFSHGPFLSLQHLK